MAIPAPRGLRRHDAAAYCGLTGPEFDAQVRAGALPPALALGAGDLWDRVALDRAFDRLSGLRSEETTPAALRSQTEASGDGSGGQRTKGPGRGAYRVAEVARILGLSHTTVYRLVNTGDLDCYRLGNTVRVGVDHLKAYLERCEQPAVIDGSRPMSTAEKTRQTRALAREVALRLNK